MHQTLRMPDVLKTIVFPTLRNRHPDIGLMQAGLCQENMTGFLLRIKRA